MHAKITEKSLASQMSGKTGRFKRREKIRGSFNHVKRRLLDFRQIRINLNAAELRQMDAEGYIFLLSQFSQVRHFLPPPFGNFGPQENEIRRKLEMFRSGVPKFLDLRFKFKHGKQLFRRQLPAGIDVA